MTHGDTCTIDAGRINACVRLVNVTHTINPRKGHNGLFVWQFEKPGGEVTGLLYGAQSARYPTGLIFDFCPYCGTNLRPAAEALQKRK